MGRGLPPGPLVKSLVIGLACAVLAALGWFGWRVWGPHPSCGPGVTKRGSAQECTGVTDGGTAFASQLSPVFARIKAENAVAESKSHVSVALMIPMDPLDSAEQQQVLHEVQGAYLAQYAADHPADGNEKSPAIRLLLANPGRDSAYWRQVSDQLAGLTTTQQDRLRAVVGFDISVASTQQTIAHLTDDLGIPVVGGPMTADDLANNAQHPDRYKGLARVTGTNSDHAAALANFDPSTTPQESLVVEDVRTGDNYIQTLRDAFESRTKGAPLAPEQFRSPADVNSDGTLANTFAQMVDTICESPTKVVYFAGRTVQLRQFVNALGGRGCTDKSYTVLTGSGASTLAEDPQLHWDALRKGVTVEYAADSHPDAWTGKGVPATGGSAADFAALGNLAAQAARAPIGPIGPVDLSDSRTIDEYDAMTMAVTAIHAEAGSDDPIPSLSDISDAWLRMHGAGKVDGSGGWICLDNYGNPYDKAEAVVRLDPDTRKVQFVSLAWPEGRPPAKDCTAPGAR